MYANIEQSSCESPLALNAHASGTHASLAACVCLCAPHRSCASAATRVILAILTARRFRLALDAFRLCSNLNAGALIVMFDQILAIATDASTMMSSGLVPVDYAHCGANALVVICPLLLVVGSLLLQSTGLDGTWRYLGHRYGARRHRRVLYARAAHCTDFGYSARAIGPLRSGRKLATSWALYNWVCVLRFTCRQRASPRPVSVT